MKNKKGFTLVELLIVIAIIGLIVVAVFYALTTLKARARDSLRAADMSQMGKALDLYFNENGEYPISTDPVCLDGSDVASTELASAELLLSPITDPFFTDTENCYRYSSSADGSTYSVRYLLETKSVGTPGYNTIPF